MKKSAQIIRKSRLTANLPTVLNIDNDKMMMMIAVSHNNTQEATAGQKCIFWTTNVSN